jgi:hypothetical protein
VSDRRTISILLVLVATLILQGCGASGDDGEPSSSLPPVDQVLSAASARMAGTEAMRFSLEVDGNTYIDSARSIQLLAARGELLRPDKVAVEFRIALFGAGTVTIRMVTIGSNSWTTDLLTGAWTTAPPEFGYNPSVLYDNQQGLGPVMGRLQDPVLESQETIDGRDAYRVTGSATSETMGPLTSNTMTGEPVDLTLWIDIETSDLLRVVVAEPDTSGKSDPATWTMNLSDHDEPVPIEPPI